MSDPMLYGITRYTMLVEVDYMGFGAGIAAEPNPDGGWINAAQTPRHQRYIYNAATRLKRIGLFT